MTAGPSTGPGNGPADPGADVVLHLVARRGLNVPKEDRAALAEYWTHIRQLRAAVVGMQVIGPALGEQKVLDVANTLEQTRPLGDARPTAHLVRAAYEAEAEAKSCPGRGEASYWVAAAGCSCRGNLVVVRGDGDGVRGLVSHSRSRSLASSVEVEVTGLSAA
ncbi:MAG: hypothetical protein JWP40_1856 [Blastococcus sp.]|nr:hypothetical protein [Blastococcus sp.]